MTPMITPLCLDDLDDFDDELDLLSAPVAGALV